MATDYDYSGLRDSIEKKRQKAAAFYRVDLHVHSIGSPASDYPSVQDKSGFVTAVPPHEVGLRSDPEEFKRQFLKSAKDKRLRIVAVTDHNEADMGETLSLSASDEVCILPGMEISVQTGYLAASTAHILAIFPVGTTAKEIDKVFPPGCGMPPSGKRDKSSATQTSVQSIIGLIHELGGVAIAAHVNSNKGIRTVFRSQDRKHLESRAVHKHIQQKAQEEP